MKFGGFTFQSGYIQIKVGDRFLKVLNIFTFQSGYIQMAMITEISGSLSSLHSNLVIFKLGGDFQYTIFVRDFTFQSGYIQIIKDHQW